MEKFSVNTSALRGYAELVQRNAGYVGQIQSYLAKEGARADEMTRGLAGWRQTAQKLRDREGELAATAQKNLALTAAAVAETAGDYETVDAQHAAEIDSVLHPVYSY
ncbi:hypothetical protein [Segniliparus rugosus]|uniref:Uncharacterized protein n=1 Tax=Segniliparus rugosus (strain ATCC BAA-974 / DSM 45345 / CCUG 50838 / CIP 108380 / JCM 13579 / CDC 945) TaxID=679197 RepID=E5XN51_SEGRC|nr:hypothetical protein [Segniliparus rugosus]EFV14228.1 hypothetical protein HMPREF9336_00921 [Segniliparus rugosus ATCC BAA-974]